MLCIVKRKICVFFKHMFLYMDIMKKIYLK